MANDHNTFTPLGVTFTLHGSHQGEKTHSEEGSRERVSVDGTRKDLPLKIFNIISKFPNSKFRNILKKSTGPLKPDYAPIYALEYAPIKMDLTRLLAAGNLRYAMTGSSRELDDWQQGPQSSRLQ